MRKQLVAALMAGLVLVTAPPVEAAAQPDAPGGRAASAGASASIDWAECGTTFKGECATVKVPVDHANPSGATLDLAIGRLKALDPARRLGVLIAHPGGPGSSGINSYITGRGIPDDSPLRQYFDIVSVDPRGVGRSNPVLCSADLVHGTPADYPAGEADYQTWLAFNSKLSQDCREHTGALFDHVSTTDAVRDIDAIRVALGEREISFFAISYGTQVGQQYAELFPQRIRAMAIDSNMDHSITSAYEYLKTTTEDFEGSFLEFAKWCGDTSACALHGREVTRVWDGLHDRAEAGRLIDPGTGRAISAEALRIELFNALYNPARDWFAISSRLKALADGEPAPQPATTPATAETTGYPYPAIWCSDWKWNVSGFAELDQYRQRLESLAPHTKISPFWFDVLTCLGWQGKVSNPQHKLKISGTPPMLLAKARYDVATPAAWNYAAASQIPGSTVLEYDGVGHGQFRNSRCARTHIEAYLINLKLPAPGTRCAAEYPVQQPKAVEHAPESPLSVIGRPQHGR
ncbi:alpha/beta hydrolase [Nonomuraea sp. NPDC050404]|uniref:alpha/beta hydrolase n=1 Tax=Nonomuraea sp. NPDC050404 TaxID=3155783 RepID=UPI0033F4A80A